MRWDEAVLEVFESGSEMVVVVNRPESLHCRGVILDGLREMTGERDLARAAAMVNERSLNVYLAMSAIARASE